MASDIENTLKQRINRIRELITNDETRSDGYIEAGTLGQSVVHDTIGGAHPIMATLDQAIANGTWIKLRGSCQTLITLYEQGALRSPRLTIAREIEGDVLDIAQTQVQAAEKTTDPAQKQVQLAIGAFLAGAAIEDALRRLCDVHRVSYDPQFSSIAKLQAALYQPSKGIEIISKSENKHISAWGDTRNKADHGKFSDITLTEVTAMIFGGRTFIETHLP
ncbi:MAG: hypothetical protein J0M16_04955 [Gammaproteobacteria bacterium]|nr:hypothetical protein [Gammaproteobacteria bacterium]